MFEVVAHDGHARAGRLQTRHGVIDTPAFMPVGTHAAVKGVSPAELANAGFRLLITNTYHLSVRPGVERIAELGGLHEFMRWPHAIATDSGGFQAFSLGGAVRVSEQGFEFASHLDGSRLLLTPESSTRAQWSLGSDIAMQLDVCPPATAPRDDLVAAVERTTRWAERCLTERAPGQALFGIVQGGTDTPLRLRHAEELGKLPFDGLALGGFSVGEPPEQMHRTLQAVVPALDPARPRYLMGVGTPSDIVQAIQAGVDLFDCVLPTRNARNGQAFTREGRISIRNACHTGSPLPLETDCSCPACAGGFNRAYLRHLHATHEMLGHRLLTLHNLHHYARLLTDARTAILRGRWLEWVHEGTLADSIE